MANKNSKNFRYAESSDSKKPVKKPTNANSGTNAGVPPTNADGGDSGTNAGSPPSNAEGSTNAPPVATTNRRK